MPYTTKTFHCDKCHKPYMNYDDADSCEIRHIVETAVGKFSADLERIMPRKKSKLATVNRGATLP